MLFKSLLAGSALLAATGSALGSSVSCDVSSVTTATAKSRDAISVIVKDVDVALCGDRPSDKYVWYDIGKKTAYAFASAVAKIEATCNATGNAYFEVNGMGAAEAQASAVAKAFAVAFSRSSNCKTCKAATAAVAEAMDTVYAKATAKAMLTMKGSGLDATANQYMSVLTKAYERETADVFVKVVLKAVASEKECSSSATAIAEAGDDKMEVTCNLNTKAYTKTAVVDSLAVAIGGAASKTCYAKDKQVLYVDAQAYAEAYALAVTEASGGCYVTGDKSGALGCVKGSAEITAVATGVAKAFAAGVAKAVSKCGYKCYVDEAKLAGALATVSVKAYSEIHVAQCTKYGYGFSVYETRRKLVGATAKAVAKLFVKAEVDRWGRCTAVVKPTAEIKPGETTEKDGEDAKLPKFDDFKRPKKARRGTKGRRAIGGRRKTGGKKGGPRRRVNKTVKKGKRVTRVPGRKFGIVKGKAVAKRVLRRRKD